MSPNVRRHIAENWQAWGVLAAAISVGFTFGWASVRKDLEMLAREVKEHGSAIVDVRQHVANVEQHLVNVEKKMDRLDCIATAQATKRDPVERCGL